jgi:hypothetical protein
MRFVRALKWNRRAGDFVFFFSFFRPFRTSWLIVGTSRDSLPELHAAQTKSRKLAASALAQNAIAYAQASLPTVETAAHPHYTGAKGKW